jgi:aspartate/methionine/tyrosine aminotransferase
VRRRRTWSRWRPRWRNGAGPSSSSHRATNRYNPSGRLTEREKLAAVSAATAEHDALLLVDEVYAPFETRPRTGRETALGGVTAAGLDETVVSNSLTKFLGFGSLRTGWLVGPEHAIDRARSVEPHFLATSGVSRRLARRVFANLDTVTGWSREVLGENNALLEEFLASRDDLDGVVTPGSTFGFVSHRSASGNEVAHGALDADVLVVPGRFFGRPDRFRLSLGGDPDRMQAGLGALGGVLDSLSYGPS